MIKTLIIILVVALVFSGAVFTWVLARLPWWITTFNNDYIAYLPWYTKLCLWFIILWLIVAYIKSWIK